MIMFRRRETENESLAEEYREILLHAEGLTTYEIVHEVSELSAKLRGKICNQDS